MTEEQNPHLYFSKRRAMRLDEADTPTFKPITTEATPLFKPVLPEQAARTLGHLAIDS